MKRGEGSELLQVVPVPWDSPSPKFGDVLAKDGFELGLREEDAPFLHNGI